MVLADLLIQAIKKENGPGYCQGHFVLPQGFEPQLSEPESEVLPLHHRRRYQLPAAAKVTKLANLPHAFILN